MSDIVELLMKEKCNYDVRCYAADEIVLLRREKELLASDVTLLRAHNAELVEALHRISLGSQNSMTSKEALGKEARAAIAKVEKETRE